MPKKQIKSEEFKRFLIIVRQANGDVLLSSSLVQGLRIAYPEATIDLLVNEHTRELAEAIPEVNQVLAYDYAWKKKGFFYRYWKEFELLKKIWHRYDLAISLTASDRSVIFAMLAGKYSIGVVDEDRAKSWWKRKYLDRAYFLNPRKHTVLNYMKALEFLNARPQKIQVILSVDPSIREKVQKDLDALGIKKFFIFHPSAKNDYKVYPKASRDRLFRYFDQAGISLVVTGGKSPLDEAISAELPSLAHLHNFIGKYSIKELIALTELSEAYVGMDTLNMHLAASLNKPIFAIFGPTNPLIWSPWSNEMQRGSSVQSAPRIQYGNITLFQANLPCVPCQRAGCDDKGGRSECLFDLSPEFVWHGIQDMIRPFLKG